MNTSRPDTFWTHRPMSIQPIAMVYGMVELLVTVVLDEVGDGATDIVLIGKTVHVKNGKVGLCWRAID